jgi:hypothetical protein
MVVFPQAIAIARPAAGVPNASDPRVGTCLITLPILPVLQLLSTVPFLQLLSTLPVLLSALPVLLLLTTAGHTAAGCRLHALLRENSPYWKVIAVGHGSSLQENDEWKSRWRII